MSLNVDLLEQSFERIKPFANDFVASFYENLFAAHPEVRPLFANIEMEQQRKKLLNSLVLIVENLRNPEVLGTVLNSLGARHIGYGAIPKYYPAVGQTLLLTFEQYLQDNWTPELKQAWTDAYGAIVAQMLQETNRGPIEAEEARSEPASTSSETTPATVKANLPGSAASLEAEIEETPALALSELPVDLLEKSFEKIKPHAETFAASFYANLFQAHPELTPLFAKTDMVLQNKKLLQSLVLVVENLRTPEALGAVLENLGARHVGYGSVPKQYGAANKILLLTFEQYLQEDWTPELSRAWKNALTAITKQMLKGVSAESGSVPAVASATSKTNIRQSPQLKTPIQHESQPFQTELSQQPLNRRGRARKSHRSLKNLLRQDRSLQLLRSCGEALKRIPAQLTQAFWTLPAWATALSVVVIMSAVFILADPDSWLGKLLAGVEAISIVVAVVLFVKETPDRKKEFHYQAWSTVDAAHGVKVSYARIMALQDLNEDSISLRGLDAPGAELVEIQLPNANLSHANLTEADLSNANLSYANLDKANLHQTKLSGANFSEANLSFALLTQANLSSVNLSGANLICADLSQANLSGANLRNVNLSGANLTGAYLTGANLKGANVDTFQLRDAFLQGATMPDGSKYRA